MDRVKKIGRQTFSSLKIRNYRLYFIGQAISWCGSWMQTIAQGLLALQLTGSGTALGVMLALQFIPSLILGLMAGVITDRYSKRKIIFLAQSSAALLALLLGLSVALDIITIWMLYVFAFLHGVIIAIDNPARHSFVIEMVGKDHLRNAISLNSSVVNFARITGPALASIVIATLGFVACFLFNAVSYLAVLMVLFMMDRTKLYVAPPAPRKKGQIMEGLRYVSSNPSLRNTLLIVAFVSTLAYEFPVILPLLAEFTFNNGTTGYAALTSAMGFGAIIGGLLSARQKYATEQMLAVSSLLLGLAMLMTAAAPTLYAAIVTMVVVGIFSINFTSTGNTILQLHSMASMRGRVMSLWTVAFLGSTPLGGPLIGWIGEFAGPRWGIAVGGFSAIIAAVFGAYILRKRKEEAPSFFPLSLLKQPIQKKTVNKTFN